jgi:hypothetical protein
MELGSHDFYVTTSVTRNDEVLVGLTSWSPAPARRLWTAPPHEPRPQAYPRRRGRSLAGTVTLQQRRQLGDVGRNAPRLILREQTGGRSPTGLFLEIDLGQRLAAGA